MSQSATNVVAIHRGPTIDSRRERTLRRSLTSVGCRVIPTSALRWDPATTHLVISAPMPCLAWLCASVSSVHIVKPSFADACVTADAVISTENHLHQFSAEDSSHLPADVDVLWAGRIWPAAATIWRARSAKGFGLPLLKHRVLLHGQLRPRGAAGRAAMSNDIVKCLLKAAGATIVSDVKDSPTFAIVSLGTEQSNPVVVQLLNYGVLCLGSAFLVDLLARVDANPAHYVIYDSQRKIAAAALDVPKCLSLPAPLPVVEHSSSAHVASRKHELPRHGPTSGTSPPKKAKVEEKGITQRPVQCMLFLRKPTSDRQMGESLVPNAALTSTPPTRKTVISPVRHLVQSPTPKPETNEAGARHSTLIQCKLPLRQPTHVTKPPDTALCKLSSPVTPPANVEHVKSPSPSRKQDSLRTHPRRSPRNRKAKNSGTPLKERTEQRSLGDSTSPKLANIPNDPSLKKRRKLFHDANEPPDRSSMEAKVMLEEKNTNTAEATNRCVADQNSNAQKSHRPDENSAGVPEPKSQDQHVEVNVETARPPPAESPNVHSQGPRRRRRRAPIEESPDEDPHEVSCDEGSAQEGKCGSRDVSTVIQKADQEKSTVRETSLGSPLGTKPNTSEIIDLVSPVKPLSDRSPRSRADDDTPAQSTRPCSPERLVTPIHFECVSDDEPSPVKKPLRRLRRRSSSCSAPDMNQSLDNGASKADSDLFSEAPRVSPEERSAISPSTRKSKFCRDTGFNFLLDKLGGAPSKHDLKRLLDGCNPDNDDNQSVDSLSGPDSDPPPQTPRRALRLDELSPNLDEDNDDQQDLSTYRQSTILNRPGASTHHSRRHRRSKEQSDKRNNATNDTFEISKIRIPTTLVNLRNIVSTEHWNRSCANDFDVAAGNAEDDELCQNALDITDWVLAAENLVGLGNRDPTLNTQGSQVHPARRLCASLAESNIIRQCCMAGETSVTELKTLTGIWTRLTNCELHHDSSNLLITELLALRDKQLEAGTDSLFIALKSYNEEEIPLRHKAIAVMWTALIQGTVRLVGAKEMWANFNAVVALRLQPLFSVEKLQDKKHLEHLQKSLQWLVDTVVLVGSLFAFRLDGDEEQSNEICPPNWIVICQCLDYFVGETGTLITTNSSIGNVLTYFLRRISTDVADHLWPMDEAVLTSASKVISMLAKNANASCFCVKPALFVSQFRDLHDLKSRTRLSSLLQTCCDCILFLGWLFAQRGRGNAMKRAMTVIRTGSVFTRGSTSGPCAKQIMSHHVGLILSVADVMAGSAANGELNLCKMLTSKCPRLDSIVDTALTPGNQFDAAWRIVVEAIAVRCKVVLAKGESVHVYTDWLSQSVVGAFARMKKSQGKRPTDVAQREALRVQDSIFANLAVLSFETLTEITVALDGKLTEHVVNSSETVLKFLQKSVLHMSSYARFANDIISQVKINPEETVSKKRGRLLCAILSLVEQEIQLVLRICKTSDKNDEERERSIERTAIECGFISDASIESMLANVISSVALSQESSGAASAKESACVALARLIELQFLKKRQVCVQDAQRVVQVLQRANLDATIEREASTNGYNDVSYVQSGARVTFWREAVTAEWTRRLMRFGTRLSVMAVCALIVSMGTVGDEGVDVCAVNGLGLGMKTVEGLKEYVSEWGSTLSITGEGVSGSEDAVLRRVEWVEGALGYVVTKWTVRTTRGLVESVREMVRHAERRSKRGSVQLQGMMLYACSLRIESGLRSTSGHWLVQGLGEVQAAMTRVCNRQSAGAVSKAVHFVQQRIVHALCTQEAHSTELRVAVLRVVNASGEYRGLFDVGRGAGGSDGRRLSAWHALIFHTIVEERMRRGAAPLQTMCILKGVLEVGLRRRDGALLRMGAQCFERAMAGGGRLDGMGRHVAKEIGDIVDEAKSVIG